MSSESTYRCSTTSPCTTSNTTYRGLGTCSTSNPPTTSCYYGYNAKSFSECGNCANTATRFDNYYTCNWFAPAYPYTVTGAVTRNVGTGTTCNESTGAGSCYKLIADGITTWLGSGSTCPIGGTCTGQATNRTTASPCTWYFGVSAGNEIKLEGLMIEGIKIN
jgi:hypothetical protein